MKRLQPVIWSKGTLLNPQHLQTQDRFIESTLQFRLEALTYCPWGFRAVSIDQEQLAGGHFVISAASGLFADGLPFDIPEADPAPPPKPLEPYFASKPESVDVYLAIPHYRERGLNVSLARQNADTRYLAQVAMMRDENTGASERPVRVAQKNFRLLMEGESRQGTVSLRIARVKASASGGYELDPQFIPPLLDIAASDRVMSILRRLVGILSAKSGSLAGLRRQKNLSLADFTAADVSNFWLLYTVNTYFPLLNHLFSTRHGHPESLFALMTSLGGALTTFSEKIQARDFPAYDHDELSGCFTELDEKLRELLETVVPTHCVSLPLKLVRPSIYATAIENDQYLVNTKMYLAVGSDLKAGDLIKKAPVLIKVCSANYIEELVKRAVSGVRLTHVPSPPSGIPVKLNYEYFSLNQSGAAWEAVGRARNLAAYVPADIPNPQMELIILLPEAI
jgi:type VI secretion system protein ImpJ